MHHTKVVFFEKSIKCFDATGEQRVLWGENKPTTIRLIMAMQAKKVHIKECILFVVQINNTNEANSNTECDGHDIVMKHPILN